MEDLISDLPDDNAKLLRYVGLMDSLGDICG